MTAAQSGRAVSTRPETVAATGIQAGDRLELAGRWRLVRETRRTADGACRVELDGRDVLSLRPLGIYAIRRPVQRTTRVPVVRWPGDRQSGEVAR